MKRPEALRAQLEKRLGELLQRAEKIEGDLRRSRNELDRDWAEAAITLENDEVLQGLDAELAVEVRQIQAALVKIEEGMYGLCEHCNGPIAKERLEALPHATACLGCARAREARG